jgi:ubiquinone/menaquinone biosynthesis C-methylase UbiE
MEHALEKTREQIAEAYKSPSWWYDARGFLILTFAYNSTLGAQLRFFGPRFGPRHLEVACGSGTLLGMTLNWRRRRRLPPTKVIAVDYAESMLAGARRRFQRDPDVEVRHGDAAQLVYPDRSFSTVAVANAMHCFPNIAGAISESFRVLEPGGTLAANILLYPRGVGPLAAIARRINDWGIRKGILVTPYTVDEVNAHLTRAGFVVDESSTSGNCYFVVARKPAE